MKKISFALLSCLLLPLLSTCNLSTINIKRLQKLEEGVDHPSSTEELKDAIAKYEKRIIDIQTATSQVGVWYKILGTRYIDNKLYGEALTAFQKALEYYPDNQNIYYYVGICSGYLSHAALDYNATGSIEKKMNYLRLAESSYKRALEIDPRFGSALYALGVLYIYELDENEKAIPYLERLLEIETKHTDGMFALARAYYSTYNFDKAITLYDKIISISKSKEKVENAKINKQKTLDAQYGGASK